MNSQDSLRDEVLRGVQSVFEYAPSIREWRVFKRELLKCVPAHVRRGISTHVYINHGIDGVERRTELIDVERAAIQHWKELTGIELVVS